MERVLPPDPGSTTAWIDRDGLRALALGAAIAAVVLALPFLRFVFSYLGTLVHELGHTVADWAFGRPAIPAFDLAHGGGVTVSQARQPVLVGLLVVAFAIAIRKLAPYPALRATVAVLGAGWAVLVLTGGDVLVVLAAGHAAEAAFAALCLYRALSGRGLRTPAERPAYAFAGIFLWCTELGFAWGLATRHEARVEYELAKGGGAWMDLSRIADEFLGVPLATVAAGHLILTMFLPVAVVLAVRYRTRSKALAERLLADACRPAVPDQGASDATRA